MVRFGIFMLFLLFFQNSNSQNSIQDVYNNLKEGNIELAKKGIDYLSDLDENQQNPSIWYYRGVVYHSIYESKDVNVRELDKESLLEAYNSYLKANINDKKKEYFNDITSRLEIAAISFYNKGVDEFNSGKFDKASDCFEYAIKINEMPMINKIDTVIYLNAAFSAENSGKNDKAEYYYKKMIDLNFGGIKIYINLAELYQKSGNDEEFISLLETGISKFPNENEKLLIKVINYFMGKGQKDKAIDYLDLAIKNNAGNATYYFVKGSIFDQLEDFNSATINYKKALEIDDNYFDANYNLGVILFNRGIDHVKIAEENTYSVKTYESENNLAKVEFTKALPFLENAHENKPSDKNTQQTLIVIYNRLQMKEKLEKMKIKFAE